MQLKHVVNGSVYQVESFLEGETPTSNGSNCTVFSGATSSTAGTSGIVPAPAAGDQGKFLRADGTWQTVGGGSDMASSNAFVYSVLTQLGNKFIPTVDTAVKFDQYKDTNLPYMDNRIKKILEDKAGYQPHKWQSDSVGDGDWYLNNTVKLELKNNSSTGANYITGGAADLTIDTDGTTNQFSYHEQYRLSESAGILMVDTWNHAKSLQGVVCLQTYKIDAGTLKVTKASRVTICPAASTNSTQNGEAYYYDTSIASLLDPRHLLYTYYTSIYNGSGTVTTYGYTTVAINTGTGVLTATKGTTALGSYYSYVTTSLELSSQGVSFDHSKPKITINGNEVSVTNGGFKVYPFGDYYTHKQNSAGNTNGGGTYVLIHHGAYGGEPTILTRSTVSSAGDETTVNEWIYDEGDNTILGIFTAEKRQRVYIITAKLGTYSLDPLEWQKETSRAWFDEFTSVWVLDYNTPKVWRARTRTGDLVQLSNIINDLDL